jgi:hypothetical protein
MAKLAALLARHAGRDEGARATGCLDDEHAEGDGGDDAVASREILGARREARRVLRDEAAALADLAVEHGILRRINVVDAAGQHRDGTSVEGGIVGGGVDTPGETRGDHETGSAQMRGKHARELLPGSGTVAGADDGDHRPDQVAGIALDVEQRRRGLDGGQGRRVAGFDGEQRPGADAGCGLQLALSRVAGKSAAPRAGRPCATTPARPPGLPPPRHSD